ncbi:hypothetical protein ACTQX2_05085 [Megamonas funiformis]
MYNLKENSKYCYQYTRNKQPNYTYSN